MLTSQSNNREGLSVLGSMRIYTGNISLYLNIMSQVSANRRTQMSYLDDLYCTKGRAKVTTSLEQIVYARPLFLAGRRLSELVKAG